MKKLKHNKTNKSGFTLVELIVSLLLFSILVAMAAMMLLSSQNAYGNTVSTISAKKVAENTFKVLNDRLSFATSIYITDNIKAADKEKYNACIKISKNKNESNEQAFLSNVSFDGTNAIAKDWNSLVDTGGYKIVVYIDYISDIDYTKESDVLPINLLKFTIDVYENDANVSDPKTQPIYSKTGNSATVELLNYKYGTNEVNLSNNLGKDLYINYSYLE